MSAFLIFVTASAVAPNLGAHLTFRFIAGFFGASPLTCAGGSISDMWSSQEKTYAFPLFAIFGFGGSVLGPVIVSYAVSLGSWRWAEWIILILSSAVLGMITLLQPETYPPLILMWKAKHLRLQTGDDRFKAEAEIAHPSPLKQLRVALTRSLHFTTEPITLVLTLYLTTLYIVLFTFLVGYPRIFEDVYGISQGLTSVLFTGLFVGVLFAWAPVPWIYKQTKESISQDEFVPEIRLWFAMLGAPALPISLFWMAWTDYVSSSVKLLQIRVSSNFS